MTPPPHPAMSGTPGAFPSRTGSPSPRGQKVSDTHGPGHVCLTPSARLPRRIWIVGPTGSGKSTLADRLAPRLGVEATHLDDLHWEPGWVERPMSDLPGRLAPVLEQPSWVIEGNYKVVRVPSLRRADLVVWLDLPLSVTFPRLLRRTYDRGVRGTLCCNGNREGLWRTFTTRDSILWWSLTTDRRRRRELTRDTAALPCVRLRTARQVEAWMRRIGAEEGSRGHASTESLAPAAP